MTGNNGNDLMFGSGGADTLTGATATTISMAASMPSPILSRAAQTTTRSSFAPPIPPTPARDDVLVLFDNTVRHHQRRRQREQRSVGRRQPRRYPRFQRHARSAAAAQIAKVSNIETISMSDSIGGAGAGRADVERQRCDSTWARHVDRPSPEPTPIRARTR